MYNSEILTLGSSAINHLRTAREALESAGRWGILDMFGHGFLTNMVKHGKLETAREAISRAQYDITSLEHLLDRYDLPTDVHIDIGGLLGAADFFADNLFVDLMVQGRINDAKSRIDQALYRLEDLMYSLRNK